MKKKITKLFLVLSFAFVACNRSISTTEEWVSFCKSECDIESVYNEFMSMTPTNSISVYRKLADELAVNENSKKETCYAFIYMMTLISMDIDSHPEKYSLAEIANFNELADKNPQRYNTALLHAIKQIDDVSTEIQTFARLSGSNMLQIDK